MIIIMFFEESLRSNLPNNYSQEFDTGIFKEAAANIETIISDYQRLKQLNISIRKSLPENLFSTDLLPINCSDTLNGSIVESSVRIGYFTVGFTMIFLNSDAPNSDFEEIGKGGFSKILSFLPPGDNTSCVAKRIQIRQSSETCIKTKLAQHVKLKQVIMEYAIYKIADLFEIGPRVVNFGFDIVCFNNSAEFYLERCTQAESIQSYRLKYCVRVLHSISFAHRDIKPHNLLYSKSKGKLVLSDYGLAKAVKENVDQKTKTIFCGTESFAGKEMKNIKLNGIGLVNLFLNDLQSADITLKTNLNNDQSGTDIISAFSNFDSDKEEQQVSTTDTNTLKSPTQYGILSQIYKLYQKNKCLYFQQYDWKKFISSRSEHEQQAINRMFTQTQQTKIRNMIYCYGYSSKLLSKIKAVDKDYYTVLKEYFSSSEAKKYLRNDFYYRFIELFEKAEILKFINKNHSEEENKKKQTQFQQIYIQLQFITLNQFKTISSSDKHTINKLLKRMKKLKKFDIVDPIWDLAIMFIQCCVGAITLISQDNFVFREKNVKDILKSLKEFVGDQPKDMFRYLSDMLILSYTSQSTIERGCVYREIVKVQQHLPQIKQLLNKCYLMKYSKRLDKELYEKTKQQVEKDFARQEQFALTEIDKQILKEAKGVFYCEQEQYQQALNQYLSLKTVLCYQFGMNRQISSTLYSIAQCYYQLGMYKNVVETYKSIRSTTGQVSAADYLMIANCHYMLGNYKRAKKYYIECGNIQQNPSGNCEYFIGCCWVEMNEWENAIKYLQNSLVTKQNLNRIDQEYYQAQMKIIDCQLYSLKSKPMEYFEYKYQQLVSTLSKTKQIDKQQSENLIVRLYIRLQILYQKFEQNSKRELVLLRLSGLKFDYKLGNLYERAGIYSCLGMIEHAYVYSYASCLGLKGETKINNINNFKHLIVERKQSISKLLEEKNFEFKSQFVCLRSGKSYILSEDIDKLKNAVFNNHKLKSFLQVLAPFYFKQFFQQIKSIVYQIGNQLIQKIQSLKESDK